jgi:VanZ family protein
MIASRHRIMFFRAALAVVVIVIFHLATTERVYPGVEQLHDKLSHILAFGILALLADFSFPKSSFGPAKMLPLLAYGVLIEVVQYFLPYREASALDVFGDAVGIALYAIGFPVLSGVPVLRRLHAMRQSD